MDYVNLVWLDPLSCKTLLQLIWPYMEEDVAIGVELWVEVSANI